MTSRKLNAMEFLDALFELFDYLEHTPDEINQILRDEGYDPDELGIRFAATARKALEENKPAPPCNSAQDAV